MTNDQTTKITPFLNVRDGKKAVDFYVGAFNAKEITRHELPQGRLNSKLLIEGAQFYVADEEPENENLSPDAHPGNPIRIILETRQADELFAKAIELGAIQICPMTTEEDWRIGKLKDPFGHVWELGYIL